VSRFTKHELFACSPRGRSALRSPSEAVVLFEFLSRSAEHQRFAHSSEEPPRFEIVDQAEQRAFGTLRQLSKASSPSLLIQTGTSSSRRRGGWFGNRRQAPTRARCLQSGRSKRPESDGVGMKPTNIDAPAPLSSVLLHGLDGYRRNDSSTYPGDGSPRRVERGARPRRSSARIMTWKLLWIQGLRRTEVRRGMRRDMPIPSQQRRFGRTFRNRRFVTLSCALSLRLPRRAATRCPPRGLPRLSRRCEGAEYGRHRHNSGALLRSRWRTSWDTRAAPREACVSSGPAGSRRSSRLSWACPGRPLDQVARLVGRVHLSRSVVVVHHVQQRRQRSALPPLDHGRRESFLSRPLPSERCGERREGIAEEDRGFDDRISHADDLSLPSVSGRRSKWRTHGRIRLLWQRTRLRQSSRIPASRDREARHRARGQSGLPVARQNDVQMRRVGWGLG
jgi:hypothetical protein